MKKKKKNVYKGVIHAFLVYNSPKERKEKQKENLMKITFFLFLVRLSPLKINLLCYQTNTWTKFCALSI